MIFNGGKTRLDGNIDFTDFSVLLQNYYEREKLDQKRQYFAKNDSSDHLMYANVVYEWEKAYDSGTSSDFCKYEFNKFSQG